MRILLFTIFAFSATMAACSAPPSGGSFSRTAELSYVKKNTDEGPLVADLRSLTATPAVALVADFAGEGAFYLTVYIVPGRDLEVREKVASLGWSRIAEPPSSAKPGSRILGTHAF